MSYKYLGEVNSPLDLKKLEPKELNILCSEIREEIMSTVSVNGGHLASNLGAVELTVALHRSFNSPDDSIIFDVGHQSYTHKLLTGRFENFSTLRQKNGISGFQRPDESEHDPVVTGHSSTSISTACGIAYANFLNGNDNYAVAVIGDGALTGGMAFEALNNAAGRCKNLIVIINDNKMSISKNVGGLARSLNKVRTNPAYYNLKSVVDKAISKIPLIGKPLRNSIYNSKLMLKNVIYHSNVFEGLGFQYYGPVDGHNLEKLDQVLTVAKTNKSPVIIHALTIKGKGYKYAEVNPNNYHGVAPFDVEVGVSEGNGSNFSNEFGKIMCELAAKDSRICAITAAMTEGTGLSEFSKVFPSRFFDVGIAEQHAVGLAAGLATKGLRPVFAVYSSFLQRAFDQVMHDVAVANLPVTFCVDRAGLVGNDGETHQGVFDVSVFSALPNVKIFSPSTYKELRELLTKAVLRESGAWIIRYPRGAELPLLDDVPFDGNFTVLKKNSEICVVSYGAEFASCYEALKDQDCTLVKLNCISEIETDLVEKLIGFKRIYLFEETAMRGGVGERVGNCLLEKGYKGQYHVSAISDEFVKQATQNEQKSLYGLDSKSIFNTVFERQSD